MSIDLLSQIDAYVSNIDVDQGVVTADEVAELLDKVSEVPVVPTPTPWKPGVRVAVAAFASVIILVGLLVFLAPSGSDVPPADQPSVTSSVPIPEGDVRGLEWVQIEGVAFEPGAYPLSVGANDSMIVIGGNDSDDAAIWTSTDRVNWTRVPHDEAIFGGEGSLSISAIIPWRDGFVAAGRVGFDDGEDPRSRGVVWISEDGLSWERVPDTNNIFAMADFDSLAATENHLVIAGGDKAQDLPISPTADIAVWTSSDGSSWHQETSFGVGGMNSVSGSHDGFIGVGSEFIWASADGSQWEQLPFDEDLRGAEMVAVTSTPSGWAAIGTFEGEPAAWTSPDGADWFRAGIVHPPETMINPGWTIASSNAGLVAVGVPSQGETVSTILVSADGDMWEPATVLDPIAKAGINSVTGFGSEFIATGGYVDDSPSLWTTRKK